MRFFQFLQQRWKSGFLALIGWVVILAPFCILFVMILDAPTKNQDLEQYEEQSNEKHQTKQDEDPVAEEIAITIAPVQDPKTKQPDKQPQGEKTKPVRVEKQLPQQKIEPAESRSPEAQVAPSSPVMIPVSSHASAVSKKTLAAFPPIMASYQKEVGWERYRRFMIDQFGGVLFIGNAGTQEIIARVGRQGGLLPPAGLDKFALSRNRDITDEDALKPLIKRAKARYGFGDFRVLILLPVRLEGALIRAIEQGVAKKRANHRMSEFSCLFGDYELRQGQLVLRLHEGTLVSGGTVTLDIPLNLSAYLRG